MSEAYELTGGTHRPTQWEKAYVKLHQENAALRQQVERLKGERDAARDREKIYHKNLDNCNRRAQAAEDALTNLRQRVDILAAAITALREGLKDLDYELNLYVATGGDWKNPRKLIHKLLSSPNPGAKVEAVVEAARAWEIRKRELHHYSWDLPLIEAVRALDKEESDETKD